MNFLRTSRKDDFVSLFYMITSLLNHNKIIETDTDELIRFRKNHNVKQYFIRTKSHKEEYGLIKIVESLSNSDVHREEQLPFYENLAQVGTVIDDMSFKDKPDYSKIKRLLRNCLIWSKYVTIQISNESIKLIYQENCSDIGKLIAI